MSNAFIIMGLNIFDFLFSFDTSSFLGRFWSLLTSYSAATITFIFIVILGSVLFFWALREFLIWFLCIKRITKQNQILIDEISHLNSAISKLQTPLFPGRKGALGDKMMIEKIQDVKDMLNKTDHHTEEIRKEAAFKSSEV